MTIDMTFEAREKIIRRDEFAAGEARGILLTLVNLVKDGILPIDVAAKRAGMTVAEFEKAMANNE